MSLADQMCDIQDFYCRFILKLSEPVPLLKLIYCAVEEELTVIVFELPKG